VSLITSLICACLFLLAQEPAQGAELKKETEQAFESYVHSAEARMDGQIRSGAFLWTDGLPERRQLVAAGQVVVQPASSKETVGVPGGLIHDWIGAVFAPGTTLDKTLALVEDYNNHKNIYKPEVIDSRLLSREGNDYKIYLRLLKKKVLTVVLNTYHDVHYVHLDQTRWYSRSYSTRITEVDNAGKPDEHELPPGEGHGFLWNLDSFWKFQERDGGVYIECEAISLTRAVPTGLGWLIQPIIRDLPRESLSNTLRETRDALVRKTQ